MLRDIVNWLNSAYARNLKLTGLIYLHGVNMTRVGGSARTNMRHFRQLCGDESMTSVALATTHWSRSPHERQRQEARHQELATNALFWKELVRKGAKVFRHDSELDSAWAIVNYLLDQNPGSGTGVHLRVQREMAAGMTLDQTTIGAAFEQRVRELSASYESQISELRADLEDMRRQGQRDRRKIDQLSGDRDQLREGIRYLQEDRGDLEAEISELQDKLREQKEYRRRLQVTADKLREQRTRELRAAKEQIWGDCMRRMEEIWAESGGDPDVAGRRIEQERKRMRKSERRERQGGKCLVM